MDHLMHASIEQLTATNIQAALVPLSNLDSSDLRALVDNDSKVDEYLKGINLAIQEKMVGENEMKMMQNKSLAAYNLSLEPRLQEGKSNLKVLMREIDQVRVSVTEKEGKCQLNSGSMTSETALALLQTAAAESEEDSEKLAELFYQKELDVEEFLSKFEETRKRMHLRRVKADKMVELVAKQETSPSSRRMSGPRRAAPPPPYPVGPNPFNPFMNNI